MGADGREARPGKGVGVAGDVLADIVRRKRDEVAAAKAATPTATLRARAETAAKPRDFVGTLLDRSRPTAVIAEVKRKSPSAGWIRPEYVGSSFAPEAIASRYHAGGAAAISCLTDGPDFGGELGFIERIRAAIPLPVLRKDFLIDEHQVLEARAAGADAVLLIAECLSDGQMRDLHGAATALGMGVLIESHDRANFERVTGMFADPAPENTLFGVNNRDLRTLKVDLARTELLAGGLKDPGRVVGESGIRTADDLARLERVGVRIVLVGEHLMRQEDPGAALEKMLAGSTRGRLGP